MGCTIHCGFRAFRNTKKLTIKEHEGNKISQAPSKMVKQPASSIASAMILMILNDLKALNG